MESRATTLPAAPDFGDVPDLEVTAEGPVSLTIEQAAALALSRNRELAVQRLNPIIVGSFELVERGDFDPELFAEISVDSQRITEVDRGTGGQFSVDADGISGAAGVRQFLPTGTTVELFADQSRDVSSRSPEQQEARVGLTVTQALLRGLGPAVNLASVRQARLDTLRSVHQLRGFALALLAETETAYWQATLAAERIAIFERSLAVAEQQRDEVRQRVDVGVLPRTELAAAEAEVARRQQGLIDTRSGKIAADFRLLRLLGYSDGGDGREFNVTSEPTLAGGAKAIDDLEERLDLAVLYRPELDEAQAQLEIDRLEVIVTRNGLLPQLDVFATIGKSGFDDTFGGSFDNLVGEDTFDYGAGVDFSYFLGNDARRGLDRAARATRQQSVAAVENLRQLVRLDVRLAAIELERARQQIAASQTTRELQEATADAEQQRFDAGASTSLLVAQAQRDLVVAELAEVEAIVAYRVALIELYRAEGTLLVRRGVSTATARS